MASLYIFTTVPFAEEYHKLIKEAKNVAYMSTMADKLPEGKVDLYVFENPDQELFFRVVMPVMKAQQVSCILCGNNKIVKSMKKSLGL